MSGSLTCVSADNELSTLQASTCNAQLHARHLDHSYLIYTYNTLKTEKNAMIRSCECPPAISAEASATDADEEANRAVEDELMVTA